MYKKNFYPSVRDRIIYNEYVSALMNNKQIKCKECLSYQNFNESF